MSSVPHPIFDELFQLRTSHGVLEKYFQTKCINRRNYYCGCGQLKTVEHVLKEDPLYFSKRDFVRKVFFEVDTKIFLDTKKGLVAIVKFLDVLPQFFCQWFVWLDQLYNIDILGVMYDSFPLIHYWWRIQHNQRLKLITSTKIATLPVSWRQLFWNSCLLCMRFCF